MAEAGLCLFSAEADIPVFAEDEPETDNGDGAHADDVQPFKMRHNPFHTGAQPCLELCGKDRTGQNDQKEADPPGDEHPLINLLPNAFTFFFIFTFHVLLLFSQNPLKTIWTGGGPLYQRTSQRVKEVAYPETVPFIQIRKKVQALWITARNRAVLAEQPDTG